MNVVTVYTECLRFTQEGLRVTAIEDFFNITTESSETEANVPIALMFG